MRGTTAFRESGGTTGRTLRADDLAPNFLHVSGGEQPFDGYVHEVGVAEVASAITESGGFRERDAMKSEGAAGAFAAKVKTVENLEDLEHGATAGARWRRRDDRQASISRREWAAELLAIATRSAVSRIPPSPATAAAIFAARAPS